MIKIDLWPLTTIIPGSFDYKSTIGKGVMKQGRDKDLTPDAAIFSDVNLSSSCSLESLFSSVKMIPDAETNFPIAMTYLKSLESWQKWEKRNFAFNDKRFSLKFSFIPPDVGVKYVNSKYDPLNPNSNKILITQPVSGDYGPLAARMFLSRLNDINNLSSVQQLFSSNCAMFTHPWLSFNKVEDLYAYRRQVMAKATFWNDLLYENCQVTSSNSIIKCAWHKYNFYGNAIVNFLTFAILPTTAVILTRAILNYMQKQKDNNNNKNKPPTNKDGSGGFTNGVPNLPVINDNKKNLYHPMDARSLINKINPYFEPGYNPFIPNTLNKNAVFTKAQSDLLDLNVYENDKFLISSVNLNGLVTSDNIPTDGSLKLDFYGARKSRLDEWVSKPSQFSSLSKVITRVAPRALVALGLSVPVVNVFAAGFLLYDTYSLSRMIIDK